MRLNLRRLNPVILETDADGWERALVLASLGLALMSLFLVGCREQAGRTTLPADRPPTETELAALPLQFTLESPGERFVEVADLGATDAWTLGPDGTLALELPPRGSLDGTMIIHYELAPPGVGRDRSRRVVSRLVGSGTWSSGTWTCEAVPREATTTAGLPRSPRVRVLVIGERGVELDAVVPVEYVFGWTGARK